MKTSITKIILFLISLLIISCSTSKRISTTPPPEKCLILDPINYNNTGFNPKWILENGIKKIVEREYLDGRKGNTHTVNILYFNAEGYIKTKYSGLGYPKDDSPNENDIFSKYDYTYEKQDSFIIQKSIIVRFYDRNGKKEKPDTLDTAGRILNIKQARKYINDNGKVIRRYEFDKMNKLQSVLNDKGKEIFKLKYLPKNIIEVEKYSNWKKKYAKSWMTYNNQGQIIRNYNESNTVTHEFIYNKKGEMIEEKSYFKGKDPNYFTYEYLK